MKQLDLKLINREAFANQRSYEAALYAGQIVNQMIRRSNQGDIIFEYENLVKPDFNIEVDKDGNFQFLTLRDGENCKVMLIGWTGGKVVCTKREIREYFKLWRIAKITNVTKAYVLE